MNKISLIFGVVGLVIGIVGTLLLTGGGTLLGAGASHLTQESFVQGLYAGTSRQLQITNSGIVSSTAQVQLSGIVSLSNTLNNKSATTTLGCLRIYQTGATTISSTTYYLVASTTTAGSGLQLFATSTKPAICN